MKRRDFLSAAGLGGLGALLAGRGAQTAQASLDRPLWIHIQCGGGWDPTVFCDPRPELNQVPFSVGTTSATTKGQQFTYADIDASTVFSKNNGYAFRTFFETYRDQLLLLNGVHAGTAGHLTGARQAASGRLQAGYPALVAMIAAAFGEGLGMPFITGASGGYAAALGHVPTTRLSNMQNIDLLAYPNSIGTGGATPLYREDEFELLKQARATRLQRLIDGEARGGLREAMQAWQRVQLDAPALADFIDAYQAGSLISHPTASNNNRLAFSVFDNAFKALIGYQQGLTVAASIQSGGFDTHNKHDDLHLSAVQNTLMAIDWILQEAQLRSVPLVLVVTSEFGRTATYNVDDGKDHWPITSWMMMQTPGVEVFDTGRLIGASDYDSDAQQILSRRIHPETGALSDDENATWLSPDALHVGLRALAGIDDHSLSTHWYPLKAWDSAPLLNRA